MNLNEQTKLLNNFKNDNDRLNYQCRSLQSEVEELKCKSLI